MKEPTGRPISVTGQENTVKVKQIHDEIFNKFRFKKHASVRYISKRTGISNRSVNIINKARLNLRFYKRTTAPKSTPKSIERRLDFSKWGKELFQVENGQEHYVELNPMVKKSRKCCCYVILEFMLTKHKFRTFTIQYRRLIA